MDLMFTFYTSKQGKSCSGPLAFAFIRKLKIFTQTHAFCSHYYVLRKDDLLSKEVTEVIFWCLAYFYLLFSERSYFSAHTVVPAHEFTRRFYQIEDFTVINDLGIKLKRLENFSSCYFWLATVSVSCVAVHKSTYSSSCKVDGAK